eukprot:15145930-Alexandrium_andersonii.AAC.1
MRPRYLVPGEDAGSHLPEDHLGVSAEHAAEPLAACCRQCVAVSSQRASKAQSLVAARARGTPRPDMRQLSGAKVAEAAH